MSDPDQPVLPEQPTRTLPLLRTLALLVLLAGYLAVGPLALVVGLVVALIVGPVRRRVWPRWRHVGVLVAVAVVGLAVVAVIPDGKLPIPPGGGLLVSSSFEGEAAEPKPIALTIEQHPGLAANGRSQMHTDGWSSDSYPGAGPLGKDPEIDTAWYGLKECATIAFDSRDRMIALCGGLNGTAVGMTLNIIDPESMDPQATMKLPRVKSNNGKKPWEDLCGGAYFYLDDQDRAIVETTDKRILIVAVADVDGEAALTITDEVDLGDEIPADDCLLALMPDWNGAGTWWVTQDGRVGLADLETGETSVVDLGEEIGNSVSADADGLYVVTVDAFYKLAPGPTGEIETLWRTEYTNSGEFKPGQVSAGSGTTPTVLPSGLVAITDNAEPRMNVQFYDTATGRLACEASVFEPGESASDNSLVAVGDAGVVVENNYGYTAPWTTILGRTTPGGFARVDAIGTGTDRECAVTWTSDVISPTSVPKVSLANGLLYSYSTQPSRWGVQAWYISAIDAATGEETYRVRTGTGEAFNNHYSAITLAPDGSLFVATLAGMVRLRDGE
ncbi:hypothetical protein [Nocardioides sp.]|uniref:hypothetical protein n=1 Tax=Nocardioides sp. TaxID=35761 RepID=UPI00356A6556